MKIGIIIAMDIEYRKMLDVLGGKPEGRIGQNDVVLWQCGIGKVNAAIGTMNLIQQHHPDCIISTGLAGGIDECLHVMDVVVGAQTCYHDVWCGEGNEKGQVQGLPVRFDGDGTLLHIAKNVGATTDMNVLAGLICTGDQFITDKVQQQHIKATFTDALACEMESAAIAHTCHLQRVPFLSIRIISDTPGNTDNHQMQWSEFLASMSNHSFRFVHEFLDNLPNSL
ncbi:MAG: 5'-methylthioadenosine/adenosylhomocysteine nucleosidase [Bacteroidales bacterium]|nr:5'-methylthioadenosine/adenosylhomocysteine nucleosidase [Bacteroidales bacterium]